MTDSPVVACCVSSPGEAYGSAATMYRRAIAFSGVLCHTSIGQSSIEWTAINVPAFER